VIASVRGKLIALEPRPVVEVGGIGLAVHVSARTAAALPACGQELQLHTYLHVREDQLSLYGFANEDERSMFLLLLGVNGVGPRLALTLLSSAPLDELERGIAAGDEAALRKLPGLGQKTAARLIVELQGKVAAGRTQKAARVAPHPVFDEAALALVSLGLTQRAARDAVDGLDRAALGAQPRVEDVVKAALQRGVRASGS
jgi:Holliday junction DNA helicase RuvA